MYEELIKRLRASVDGRNEKCDGCPYEEDYPCCVDCLDKMHKQAADAIEELSAYAKLYEELTDKGQKTARKLLDAYPRWISVEERLPDCQPGAEVGNIEWICCGMVHAGCFGRGGKYRDAYFRTWTDGTEGIDAKDADYWRAVSLPESPKEETCAF